MDILIHAAAAGGVGSILALLLRKYTPELGLTLAIVTGAVILWISATVAFQVTDTVRDLAADGGVDPIYLSPVIKCVGIALVTHLASQICRDAQQGSVASALELCGTLCALYVSLPLIRSLLATVGKLV